MAIIDEEFEVSFQHFDMHLGVLCLEYYDKLSLNSEKHIQAIVCWAAGNKRINV
jgi:hypothetical protein